jgi:2-keto-4-pentenoate hydratase/2-oxohepta-3-ene-1,7-dioic acid hydratase in catechol pathway
MLVARVRTDQGIGYGVLDALDPSTVHLSEGDPFSGLRRTGRSVALDSVCLSAPVTPGKVIVIGRNYGDRGSGPSGPAVVFLKPSTAVVGPCEEVVLPPDIGEVRFEAELAVVIGRRCKDVPAGQYRAVVLGYTCANDVTAWDIGTATRQWSKAKSFDTFCPLGPWIATGLEPGDLAITTEVNGTVRQRGSTADMLRPVPTLIAEASRVMTLEPGDTILTGTPAGSGSLHDGDQVRITVEGVGTLSHSVRAVS